MICPSNVLTANPVSGCSNRFDGLTSYGGNGGTRSFDPQFAANDGIFWVIGPRSQTAPTGQAAKMSDALVGLSNTPLFGERSHVDHNHGTFAKALTPPNGGTLSPMSNVGWWSPSGGRLAAGDVLLSTMAPINCRVPTPKWRTRRRTGFQPVTPLLLPTRAPTCPPSHPSRQPTASEVGMDAC